MSLETTENKRKRLIFRSWHRGTKEMDILLGSFADKYVPEMDEGALAQYDALLNIGDPELYDWYLGKADVPANDHSAVMKQFLDHKVVEREDKVQNRPEE
ncbi:MAG: succinate dehydrogenase assembly factor 2 [Alphaproteobacteria bacterium]|nr:succinate dehydrogenase assembly factor 2 [Alphaproteobacteria bacterium]